MADEQEQKGTQTLKFTYFKSSQFRVIKADGVWGGLSPRGELIMTIFNERPAIPSSEEYAVTEEGNLGQRILSNTDAEGIVREVEVAISLRPEIALVIAHWLLSKVAQFETATGIKIAPEDVLEQPPSK